MHRFLQPLALFAFIFISLQISAASRAASAVSIIGTWKADVAITEPAGFPNFMDLFGFTPGGILTESHALYSPYHPLGAILYAPGLGAWQYNPDGTISAVFVLAIQGAPGNINYAGQHLGTNTIRYRLAPNADGTRLSGEWTATGHDLQGNINLSAAGTMTAERVVP